MKSKKEYRRVEKEIWKDIPGYSGRYKVSNYGRIRSFVKGRDKSHLMMTKIDRYGYEEVSLTRVDGKKVSRTVHRIVAETFLEKGDETTNTVNHKNGVKVDNRLKNLEWVTVSENQIHAVENLLSLNTHPIFVLDITTGESKRYRSVKSFAKEIGLSRNVVVSLIKYSSLNPILDKYVVKVTGEVKMEESANTRNDGRKVYFFDRLLREERVYESFSLLSLDTGLRSSTSLYKEGSSDILGFSFSHDRNLIKKEPVENPLTVLKERVEYFLNKKRKVKDIDFFVYDYRTGKEYEFVGYEKLLSFINSRHGIRAVRKGFLSSKVYQLRNGESKSNTFLAGGLGITIDKKPEIWDVVTESDLLCSEQQIQLGTIAFKVTVGEKTNILFGSEAVVEALKEAGVTGFTKNVVNTTESFEKDGVSYIKLRKKYF